MQASSQPGSIPSGVRWYHQKWFVVIALLIFFPVGLYLLWKSPVTKLSGRIVWTAIIVLCVIINVSGRKNTPAPGAAPAATPAPASNPAPAAPAPGAAKPFAQAELTKDSVTKASGIPKVTEVVINDDAGHPGQKILLIHYDLGTAWDETSAVKDVSRTAVAAFEKLFAHPAVSDVRIWADTTFTDQYGKENTNSAVQISWSRTTAEKVNWKNFKDMVLVDFKRAFSLADAYSIHPGLYQKLDDKSRAQFPIMK